MNTSPGQITTSVRSSRPERGVRCLDCGGDRDAATVPRRRRVRRAATSESTVDLAFPVAPLEAGLIVGQVTDTTARIWVRLPSEAPHTLLVRDARASRAVQVVGDPRADRTAVVELDGLAPDTRHALDLVDPGGRSILPGDLAACARTLPARTDRLCFAFTSCHLPFARGPGSELRTSTSVATLDGLLEAIERRDVRFVLHLGDQVYVDAPGIDVWAAARRARREGAPFDALEAIRSVYRAFFAVPALRAVHARVPNLMTWDDGEIHDTWGSVPLDPDDESLAPELFAAARRAFCEYQRAHGPRTDPRDLHFAFDAGPAAFFVLDLRSQRDHARRVLLGDRQWQALEGWLASTRDRPIRFLASPVPPLHVPDAWFRRLTRRRSTLARVLPPAVFDRWSADAFHGELERLRGLLRVHPRVVVLAGDIHVGAAIDVRSGPPQWIASAITNPARLVQRLESVAVARAAGATDDVDVRFVDRRNNFGVVEVERDGDRVRASFELWVRTARGARPAHRVEATF